MPSEQERTYQAIWANLRQMDNVMDGRHDTVDWYERKGDFVIMCARIPEGVLDGKYADFTRRLSHLPYARVVPRPILNITIQELGYLTDRPRGRDEITQDWLDEFIQQAEIPIRAFRPFEISLGGANAYADAAFLDVHDGGWFHRIQANMVDLVSQPPRMRHAYLPELIIVQFIDEAPIQTLVRDLLPWRDTNFGRFTVERLDILKFDTSVPFSRPELVHTFELGKEEGFIRRVSPAQAQARESDLVEHDERFPVSTT